MTLLHVFDYLLAVRFVVLAIVFASLALHRAIFGATIVCTKHNLADRALFFKSPLGVWE